MASKSDVVINVIAETQKAVAGMAAFAAGIGAAVATAKKLVDIGKKMVAAFGQQEEAEAKLAAAIRATGKQQEINQDQLQRLASSLQKVTRFGDEATISATAMLQQLADLNQQGLEKVIPAMLDFASAMNVDLNTAATLLGKTLGSSTNALSRYGIELDTSGTKTEKLAELVERLDEKFGGMAATMADTTLGALEQFGNELGDLTETGGEAISKWLEPTVTLLTKLTRKVNETISSYRLLKSVFAGQTTAFEAAIEAQRKVVEKAREAAAKHLEEARPLHRGTPVFDEKRLELLREISAEQEKLVWLQEQLKAVIGETPPPIGDDDGSLDKLNELYAKTAQAQREALESSLAWVEGLEIQEKKSITTAIHLRAQIAALDTTAESFDKLALETQLANTRVEIFIPTLEEFTAKFGTFNPIVNDATEYIKRFGEGAKIMGDNFKLSAREIADNAAMLVPTLEMLQGQFVNLYDVVSFIPEVADPAGDAIDNLGASLGSMISSGVLDSLEAFGESMANGATGAEGFKSAIDSLGMMLLNVLPRLLLTAGLEMLVAQNYPLGIALIAASGLIAIGGGLAKGNRNSAGSTAAALPDADTVAASRHGVTFGAGNAINPQITNYNIAGNALVSDQFGELIRTQSQAVYSGR